MKNTKPSHSLESYAGSFTNPTWGSVAVALENGALVFRIGPSPRNAGTLEHWNCDTFRVRLGDGRGGWKYIGFNTDLNGEVSALVAADPTLVFQRDRQPAK